ncbi:MAG: DUF6144 family protein [Anaerolineae bacterium]
MSDPQDFERAWLEKLTCCLDEIAGEDIRRQVMQGSERLSSQSDRGEVIAWSQQAMERLDALVDEKERRDIMTGCACQYPKSELQEARQIYEATGDIDLAHRKLQEQFETFLKDVLALDDDLFAEVVRRGLGLAGVRHGDTIIATKIPKSGFLVEYMREADPERRRQCYCHCPRIREALKTSEAIPATYCYCGAGFYKGIWEEILQQSVEVEVLESVLQGDDACKIAIYVEKPETLIVCGGG